MQEHRESASRGGVAERIVLIELFPAKIYAGKEVLAEWLKLQVLELHRQPFSRA